MSESAATRARGPDDYGSGWNSLDRDTLTAITCCLDCATDVASLACTCREARHITRTNAVWGPLLASQFGLNVKAPEHVALASLYRQLHQAMQGGASGGGGEGGAAAGAAGDAAAAAAAEGGGSSRGRVAVRAGAVTQRRQQGQRQLLVAGGGGAVQLEGLFTDGGMDEDDPAFW
ncbi:hypothetical protein Agub_g12670, partial [Astrephomene gubernaculifera]